MKLLIKFSSGFLIFVAPIILVIQRYNQTETTIETSFGLFPTIIVVGVGSVLFGFISQQFMEMVRTNKFGFLSIAFFGVLLAILMFGGLFILSAILNTAQANYEAFVSNYEYHIQTLTYGLAFVIGGIAVSMIYLATQWKIKKP
jgi:hypothetical protein